MVNLTVVFVVFGVHAASGDLGEVIAVRSTQEGADELVKEMESRVIYPYSFDWKQLEVDGPIDIEDGTS